MLCTATIFPYLVLSAVVISLFPESPVPLQGKRGGRERSLREGSAKGPQRRAAALVLEVKGDFCHDIHRILIDAGCEKRCESNPILTLRWMRDGTS